MEAQQMVQDYSISKDYKPGEAHTFISEGLLGSYAPRADNKIETRGDFLFRLPASQREGNLEQKLN